MLCFHSLVAIWLILQIESITINAIAMTAIAVMIKKHAPTVPTIAITELPEAVDVVSCDL